MPERNWFLASHDLTKVWNGDEWLSAIESNDQIQFYSAKRATYLKNNVVRGSQVLSKDQMNLLQLPRQLSLGET